jgi:hypothetical protein
MSDVTLSGAVVLACTVHLPAWGVWWADVETGESAAQSGAVTLSLPGLDLSGSVVSGAPWEGRARYRVAGGAGQWGASVGAKSYANDLGVKVSTVICDAASACGETFDASTASGTVGPQWVREAGPAGRQLALLAPRAWYVGEDGTTRLGARSASTYGADYTVMARDEAGGWVELAAADLSGLVPGATVADLEAVDVVHTLDAAGRLRTRLYAAHGTASRQLGALGRVVEGLMAAQRYRGVWSYRVVAQTGERLDLQIERVSTGMPDLQLVRTRYAPGYSADHTPGSMVLVAFVDGDPGRPVVVAGDDPESPGHAPAELAIESDFVDVGTSAGDVALAGATLAPAVGRIVCEGDTISIPSVPPISGAITITAQYNPVVTRARS